MTGSDRGFHTHRLPTAKISNTDVTRLINSDEIQSVVRPGGQPTAKSEPPLLRFAAVSC